MGGGAAAGPARDTKNRISSPGRPPSDPPDRARGQKGKEVCLDCRPSDKKMSGKKGKGRSEGFGTGGTRHPGKRVGRVGRGGASGTRCGFGRLESPGEVCRPGREPVHN